VTGAAGSGSAPDVGTAAIRKLRHDLSNPLAAVLAETQLILLNADTLDAEVVSGLKQIEALARKMRDILERVG
jgi:signal transduction histidine kinase